MLEQKIQKLYKEIKMPSNYHQQNIGKNLKNRQNDGTVHNPVPFDFVPFSNESPLLQNKDQWENINRGNLLSGHIKYEITVKTPLHIVGAQNKNPQQEIIFSSFLRRNSKPVIPGSGIKGMLRSFMEALTNSWVSQVTEEYRREKGRAYGFNAIAKTGISKDVIGPTIPEKFHPMIKDGAIDLTSFIFGAVIEGSSKDNAFPSRFIFEDIIIDENFLDENEIELPDVPGEPFMGGPKPRINNWWYFRPQGISKKEVRIGGSVHKNTDFMGNEYWGRKFFYHQKPENVLKWYADNTKWPHLTQRKKGNNIIVLKNYRSYPVEIIKENSVMKGRIFFEKIPPTLLGLFILSLCPKDMAHKLGYGQAFGLGSIQIQLSKMCIHQNDGFDIDEQDCKLDPKVLTHSWYDKYVDKVALKWLMRILSYDEAFIKDPSNIFTYPLFSPILENCSPGEYPAKKEELRPADFTKLVKWNDAVNAAVKTGASKHLKTIDLTINQAQKVAEQLWDWDKKKTIHFRLYQERSMLWSVIEKRG